MALKFNGSSQYIQVTQNSGLPIYDNTSYSVCGWMKGPAQDDGIIYSEGSSTSFYPLLTLGSGYARDFTTGLFKVFVRNQANVTLLSTYSTTTVFDNAWHHFCWVDNNGDADLYIDGTLDATNFNYTRSGTFTLNKIGIAVVIRDSLTHWFNGELFDIRCYNRCLTANEIAEIYHKRGADRVWQGLVGWWRLDDLPSGTPAPLLLDAMDATTGWTTDYGVVSLNTTTYKEGSGALNMTKTTTTQTWNHLRRDITAVNLTNQTIKLWVYIKDSTALNKIKQIEMMLGQDVSNRYQKIFDSLSTGWNLLSAHIDDFSVFKGSPDKTAVDFISVVLVTVNASDTLAEGDVIYDFYRAGDYPLTIPDLSGNGNHGTPYNAPIYQDSPHRLRRGVIVS